MQIRAAVLTVSDKASRGEREDTSGQAIRALLDSIGAEITESKTVPDEADRIAAAMRSWADSDGVDLIVSTGGTGLGPRDVTPEATASVIERPVPGLGEMMRIQGIRHTPMAALSRGIAGVRGRCLIVNLPGSPKGVRENLTAIIDVLPHAVGLLRGRVTDHTAPAPAQP